jgi:hypothetical protein
VEATGVGVLAGCVDLSVEGEQAVFGGEVDEVTDQHHGVAIDGVGAGQAGSVAVDHRLDRLVVG